MAARDLLAEHLPRLYRTAWMLTRNESDAQDLVHDAMLSALQSFGRFRAEAQTSTWLTTILVNRYRTWCRSRAVRDKSKRFLEARVPQVAADPSKSFMAAEEREILRCALDRLDDQERLLVTLSTYEGLNSKQIGELLDRPPGTIRSRLHLAREKLRELLSENLSHDE